MGRSYDALVLDVDGTLLDEQQRVHPRTLRAITAARAAGVVVMLATGRAHGSTRGLMREIGLDVPAVVFNGAAVYCPREDRLIEVNVLVQFHGRRRTFACHARAFGSTARTPKSKRAPAASAIGTPVPVGS